MRTKAGKTQSGQDFSCEAKGCQPNALGKVLTVFYGNERKRSVERHCLPLSSALRISELQINEGLHFAAAHLDDDEYQEEKQDELHNERFARQKTAGGIAP